MELEKASFRNPWSLELLQRELGHDWSIILLAGGARCRRTGAALGIAIFWIVHDEVHVLNVATAPRHRRRGVGRARDGGHPAGGERASAAWPHWRCAGATSAAICLYKSLGFRPVGVRPNYYVDEPPEDAIVMVLDF